MLLSPPLYLNSKKTACTHCIFCKQAMTIFLYLFGQGSPINFISVPPTPPPPPPRLHVLTTTCTYVLSWWERERTKIQQQPWALKEKRSTMIDHSNCRWSLSDNPAQNLGCDCWPASLCLACSRLRESREHENKMERNWEEKGLSPFLCPSTAPFSQIIHTHFHLPFTLYDVLMVCYFYDFSEDEQFNDEKTYLIKQIKEL